MTDRERILGRIREASRCRLGAPVPGSPGPALSVAEHRDPAALARVFRKEAEAQSAQVHEAADAAGTTHALEAILEETGARTALCWSDPFPAREAVRDALRARGVREVTPLAGPPGPPARAAFKAASARADVGVTGSDFALADSGTLVLLSSPGQGRSASLLPPVHVAILPASRILPDLPALLTTLPRTPADALKRGSVVTLVTGTSKTADIELTLVRGVHGPGELHVILISGY